MEPPKRVAINYSLKNIPIPSPSDYKKRLIEMVESVLKRMRWRAFFFLRGDTSEKTDYDDHYGLNSRRCPPQVNELKAFEEDMAKMIQRISFKNVNDDFQDTLRRDVATIKSSQSIFVRADKTRNLYELGKDQHEKLMTENITKHYKAASENAYAEINTEAQDIADRHRIANRVDAMAKREAFLTLKDHKENFEAKLPCRLINPAKTELGIVSKRVLDGINQRLKNKLDVTLWRNTAEVLDWFRSIEDKQRCTFTTFDVVEFYPSITSNLLQKALDFARKHVDISNEDMDIIWHSRKSLLFNTNRAWVKKNGTGLFDVAMGSYDGAEVCELVGMFVLAQLPARYRSGNAGLYRDDGLAVFHGISGSEAERISKDLHVRFNALGLRITVASNLKVTNFLDTTLNLSNGKHYPYRKPNDTPLYVHRHSNHPPSILNHLPAAIGRRLTDISHDAEVFANAVAPYDEALKISGYKEKLQFMEERKGQHRRAHHRNRNRKITWFNPPYSKSVTTNVGRTFLSLIDRHFPKGSALHAVFNRNTVKVSYSCMRDIASIIQQHNSHVRNAEQAPNNEQRRCNCRKATECPFNGECLTSEAVYQATINTDEETAPKIYVGASATTLKLRLANHQASFRHEAKENSTELSKHIWHLKRAGRRYSIKWRILKRARAYTSTSKRCNLCTTEKLAILEANKSQLLNKRSELVSKCRHENKFYLQNFARTSH